MGNNWYEILGGVLIVLSSLVGEQMKRMWKVGFYAFFLVVALVYTGIGIHMRRQADSKEAVAQHEREQERNDMSNILKTFSALGPTVAAVNADVAIMRRDLEAAKEKHDPQVIAELEAKINASQKRSDKASATLFVALVPGVVRQLRDWQGSWSSPEGKTIIGNANFVRQGLLRVIPETNETQEDKDASRAFAIASREGSFGSWNTEHAAHYLEQLAFRTGIPTPVTNLSVTVQ